ncbi:MAG: thioredoxin-dependent thiol peroxidase [Ignavibacteriaceae bacterium]|jgi:peroxiredoxin Q/BCP
MIEEGKFAPSFSLTDQDGKTHSLKDYLGKNVVLYFYPKDNTPGCTKEACSFRDEIAFFKKNNTVILGISADSVKSHKNFSDKFSLPFPLLSDESKKMIEAYGVWKEKSMYGKKYLGIERTTVIIDEKGKIKKIFPKVKVEGHTEEVLEALK